MHGIDLEEPCITMSVMHGIDLSGTTYCRSELASHLLIVPKLQALAWCSRSDVTL